MSYRTHVARTCPSTEFLNLTFGVLISVAVNVLTSVAMDRGTVDRSDLFGSLILLSASLTAGLLTLTIGRWRSEVLDNLGTTFSGAERRAELNSVLREKAGVIASLEVGTVSLSIVGILLLFIPPN
jgi:hypothetical protein